MAISNISPGVWTSVTTTAEDTAFQNRGGSVMYLTTEVTGSLSLNDGIAVPPGLVVVIAAGKNVSVCFPTGAGSVHYVGV